jgi:NAD(P)-dependent dehydrogenase (short-subunit alcohol dehydrogenase family)
MTNPFSQLRPGHAAVVTGAAGGIGLAAATALAARGLNVVMSDTNGAALAAARDTIGGSALAVTANVAAPADVARLKQAALDAFGAVNLLMNNAGIGANPGKTWENGEGWRALIDVNFWGAVNGVEAFAPLMLAQDGPGVIINTGSKQGITLPPGNSAYNVSKAALKAYTEILAHELREAAPGRLSAHLLIPGWTQTGMTKRGEEKPPGAWTADQVAHFMLDALERGDFYILCPDNDTPRALDERRTAWMAGDLIENRPALSRWSATHSEAFAAFVKGG